MTASQEATEDWEWAENTVTADESVNIVGGGGRGGGGGVEPDAFGDPGEAGGTFTATDQYAIADTNVTPAQMKNLEAQYIAGGYTHAEAMKIFTWDANAGIEPDEATYEAAWGESG